MSTVSKYSRLFDLNVKENFAYRADYLLNLFSAVAMITVQYFLWSAVFSGQSQIQGFNFSDMISYIVVIWAIYSFINTQSVSYDIQNQLLNGDIGYDFLMPLSLYFYYLIRFYSQKILNLVIIGLPVFIFSIMFFNINLTGSLNIIFFLLSVQLSFFISYNISFLVGLLSIFFKNIEGFIQLEKFLKLLLSGALVPLAFFPDWVERITTFFPYRYVNYIPSLIFIGKINSDEILTSFFIQLVWAVSLSLVASLFFRKIRNKVVIFGG
ncbi:MAG: ABC transporter permease [bacterium]